MWQFISAALLGNLGGEHQLVADIECFVHVFRMDRPALPFESPMDGYRRKELVSLLDDHGFRTATGQEERGHSKADKLVLGDFLPSVF